MRPPGEGVPRPLMRNKSAYRTLISRIEDRLVIALSLAVGFSTHDHRVHDRAERPTGLGPGGFDDRVVHRQRGQRSVDLVAGRAGNKDEVRTPGRYSIPAGDPVAFTSTGRPNLAFGVTNAFSTNQNFPCSDQLSVAPQRRHSMSVNFPAISTERCHRNERDKRILAIFRDAAVTAFARPLRKAEHQVKSQRLCPPGQRRVVVEAPIGGPRQQRRRPAALCTGRKRPRISGCWRARENGLSGNRVGEAAMSSPKSSAPITLLAACFSYRSSPPQSRIGLFGQLSPESGSLAHAISLDGLSPLCGNGRKLPRRIAHAD
jgi:hypothetical protein